MCENSCFLISTHTYTRTHRHAHAHRGVRCWSGMVYMVTLSVPFAIIQNSPFPSCVLSFLESLGKLPRNSLLCLRYFKIFIFPLPNGIGGQRKGEFIWAILSLVSPKLIPTEFCSGTKEEQVSGWREWGFSSEKADLAKGIGSLPSIPAGLS